MTTGAARPGDDVRHIDTLLIDVPEGRRVLDPDWVSTLAADFRLRGQQTAIELIQRGDRFQLVYGAHRLDAAKVAEWTSIRAIVRQPGEFISAAQVKLAEIVENFMRRELSVLDRAFDVAAWREIFEAVNGEVKRGGDRRGKQSLKSETLIDDAQLDALSSVFADNFTVAAQKALRLSKAAVFRSLKIARLGEHARQRISLLSIADNQTELLALCEEPSARQALIIDKLLDGAVSVADAIGIIDNLAPEQPAAVWERMSERFARLPSADQHQFFTLHEDAILQWVASRKA
ncbi:ParB N-terminal domain-containing protein [Devosia sp.]|uniref:ParB N-terminal domain-containing protein n=1 Tax=Devosia sp. TaxID=1871048 RepID=UPI001AD39A8E|nr:ParB N-terminal domain-containing protein [Devosia sp.]MBN9333264.1 ParB N-terminal domain-containing protein [Devosia sp.]